MCDLRPVVVLGLQPEDRNAGTPRAFAKPPGPRHRGRRLVQRVERTEEDADLLPGDDPGRSRPTQRRDRRTACRRTGQGGCLSPQLVDHVPASAGGDPPAPPRPPRPPSRGLEGRSVAAAGFPGDEGSEEVRSHARSTVTAPIPTHPIARPSSVLAPMALTLLLSTASAAPRCAPLSRTARGWSGFSTACWWWASVLYVAAHPDDENTRLLAFLSNAMLLRAGYLSVTRGDGGQNLIGPELGPGAGAHPHPGAARRARGRRRRAALHPRAGLRLLQEPGRVARHLGPRRGARRRGARHPPLPARRDHHPLPDRGRRHPRPPHRLGAADRGGVRRARPTRPTCPTPSTAGSGRGRRRGWCGTSAAVSGSTDAGARGARRSSTSAATTPGSGSRTASSPPTAAATTRARASAPPGGAARCPSTSSSLAGEPMKDLALRRRDARLVARPRHAHASWPSSSAPAQAFRTATPELRSSRRCSRPAPSCCGCPRIPGRHAKLAELERGDPRLRRALRRGGRGEAQHLARRAACR